MISISVYVFPAAEFGIGIDICQYRRMSKSLTVLEPAGTAACCPPLSAQPLSQAQAEQVAPLLKALADPVRLRLMSLVASHPGGEACVCAGPGWLESSAASAVSQLRLPSWPQKVALSSRTV